MAADAVPLPLVGEAGQLAPIARLCNTKPAMLEEFKRRIASGTPLVVKGTAIPLEVTRAAVEQIESGADIPTMHSTTAAGSGGAAPVGPPGEAAVFIALESAIQPEQIHIPEDPAPPPPLPPPAEPPAAPTDGGTGSDAFQLRSFEGKLQVRFNSESMMYELVQLDTFDRIELPRAETERALDVGGWDAELVEATGGGRKLDAVDLLNNVVYIGESDGETVLQTTTGDLAITRSLDEALASAASFTLNVKSWATAAADPLDISIYELRRDGNFVFFSLPSVMLAIGAHWKLHVKSFLGHQFPGWNAALKRAELGRLCNSVAYDQTEVRGSDAVDNRAPKEKAASATSLLYLLVRWIMLGVPQYRVRPIFSLQVMWRFGDLLDMRITGLVKESNGTGSCMELEANDHGDSKAMQCALYVKAAESLNKSNSMQFISHAPDKSRVHNFGILNTFFAMPNNVGFWGIPQDPGDFMGEASMAEIIGGEEGKKVALKAQDRDNVAKWPRLSISPDQGSDGVAGIPHWLHTGINVDPSCDFSHGVHNDIYGGIEAAGPGCHISMSLRGINVPVSPWDENLRRGQVTGALKEAFATTTASTNVSFQDFVDDMLAEPAGREFADAPEPAGALWNLKESDASTARGGKTLKNRFLAVIRKIREELNCSAQRKFGYLLTCVGMDMVDNAKFARLVRSGAEFARTANSRVETEEEKSLRKSCANQVVAALMDWLGPDTTMLDKIIVGASEPCAQWLGEQR
ncbi:unnamed protein product [Prorocentrum cordatum]|uniref:Uncharacterized protein n=1 Tax=Prorocentrum cordatum TaxID=2364126 RepID=A0ABN9XFA2_9DINO|nr:unnamed protein product [Polarella glacialis]